ncbi:MAG: RNA polymerase sigma factor [Anaerolineae bacterium]|nr:RNA polymerase sigma factor [Anaerolineae bacterium]
MEERTNETWLSELRPDHPHQAQALEDLRLYLQRGILAYLHGRSDLRHRAENELQQMSEDLAQEALLKVQANLDTFQGKSKFTTWAAKIAANHTISELRRARWRDLSLDAITEAGTALQEILVAESPAGGNPATESERRQVWDTILAVINNDLTERQRQALAAVQIDNIPIAEVARLLETNPNNVYKLLHDARMKLKQRLQKLGLEPQYILKLFSEER